MPKARKRGTRFADIADHAGVGIATVDRVLNERGNVSADTASRVIRSAEILGVNRVLPTPWRARRRYRVILPRGRLSVAERLNQAFIRLAMPWRSAVTIERSFVDDHNPEAVVEALLNCEGTADGVIVVPTDHACVRDAVDRLSGSVSVVTLVSDLRDSARRWFVGIDNHRAGRTAGFICGRAVQDGDAVAEVWRGPAYSGQEQRIAGFEEVLRAQFPRVEVHILSVESNDSVTIEGEIERLFSRTPNLRALYNAGLLERPVSVSVPEWGRGRGLCYAAHELTDGNIDRLKRDLIDYVIDQNPERQAHNALELLLAEDHIGDHDPVETTTGFDLYCRENI